MSRRVRYALALVALAALGAALVAAVVDLEPFGHYPGPYGDVLAKVVPGERHTGQLVAAVTFDYRGFDTLGEELILFSAASGCVALLRLRRRERGEEAGAAPSRPVPSLAARALGGALVGPVLVLSAYVIVHGHLTPGGGFSGGVIGAGALLLAYAAGQIGAGGFVLVALGGLIAVGATLQNFLPLGTSGMLLSAGTIPVGNVAVGIEVAGAGALIIAEFLEQALLEGRE
jgi:multicomponent Na+:H+ antiporter subunit B